MTWWFDLDGSTMDVYDHEGTQVATGREFDGNLDLEGIHGSYPSEVLAVMKESYESGGPTAYNQQLNRDAATGNIREGTPP